jgi:type I restriction enzyme S subunit
MTELGEVSTLVRGVSYKKEDAKQTATKGLVPVLRATNITGSALTFENLVYVPARYVSDAQRLKAGDIVIASSSGSKEIVGKSGQVSGNPLNASFGAFCTTVRPEAEISARYLGLYFQSPAYREAISEISAGSNINNIKSSELLIHLIPVAAKEEQTRIVEKLEELLSDLDAGVAELKAAQRKLAQYRQSLLKAAVEGALTADWRAARRSVRPEPVEGHPSSAHASTSSARTDEGETGADLLQRILTERRTRWESKQLAKFAERDKTPPKDWKSKYSVPVAAETTDLPALPEGWVWANVEQLTEFVTSGSRGWADYYADRGATFIRSQNINKDWLDLSDIAFVDPPRNSEGARTRVQRDDLLLTITGANVGKSAWVNVDLEEAYVSQHVALIRPVESDLSAYLHLFLTCKAGGRGQLDNEAYGAGKPGLNLQQVLSVVVPLPSPHELLELLSAVASALDAATTQEASIAHALQQSAAQRKNILKAAFAGQLVPQDPNDEPASALLERIRAERVASGTMDAKRGRKTARKITKEAR